MERINIALPSDENYVCGLTATAGSIAMHASRDVTLVFHILDGGIRDDTFAVFEKLIREWHPHCEFVRHRVDESVFKDFPAWSGNRMTYARLMIPRFMPNEEFCIYCDTDFLWLTDIAELWRQCDSKIIFQGAPETYALTLGNEEAWFKKHGLPFNRDHYACGGLSIYNIQKFTAEDIVRKIGCFIAEHPDIRMADQTAMNALLFGRIKVLDSRWQRLTVCRENGEPVLDKAFHYAGEIPWKRSSWNEMLTDTILLWHKVNGRLHRKSAWWSLRQYFSVGMILKKRLLWHVVMTSWTRKLFYGYLQMSGRASLTPTFDTWAHRISYDEFKKLR